MFNLLVLTKIVIILAMLMNTTTALAATNNFRVTQPSKNIQSVSRVENKAGMRELARMEKEIFGRSFTNETQNQRVSRLEREMFGMNQTGDVNARFDNLRAGYRGYHQTQCPQPPIYHGTAPVYPYSSTYPTPYPYPYSTPIIKSGGGLRGVLNSFGNFMLGGTPTGFSPQVNPTYTDWYDDRYMGTSGYSKGFTSNRGYGYHNTNTGGSTGVTILD